MKLFHKKKTIKKIHLHDITIEQAKLLNQYEGLTQDQKKAVFALMKGFAV